MLAIIGYIFLAFIVWNIFWAALAESGGYKPPKDPMAGLSPEARAKVKRQIEDQLESLRRMPGD